MNVKRRMDDWIGLRVRLLREIKTAGGKVYAAGSWWTVMSHHRGRLALLSGVGCLSNFEPGDDDDGVPWCDYLRAMARELRRVTRAMERAADACDQH